MCGVQAAAYLNILDFVGLSSSVVRIVHFSQRLFPRSDDSMAHRKSVVSQCNAGKTCSRISVVLFLDCCKPLKIVFRKPGKQAKKKNAFCFMHFCALTTCIITGLRELFCGFPSMLLVIMTPLALDANSELELGNLKILYHRCHSSVSRCLSLIHSKPSVS